MRNTTPTAASSPATSSFQEFDSAAGTSRSGWVKYDADGWVVDEGRIVARGSPETLHKAGCFSAFLLSRGVCSR